MCVTDAMTRLLAGRTRTLVVYHTMLVKALWQPTRARRRPHRDHVAGRRLLDRVLRHAERPLDVLLVHDPVAPEGRVGFVAAAHHETTSAPPSDASRSSRCASTALAGAVLKSSASRPRKRMTLFSVCSPCPRALRTRRGAGWPPLCAVMRTYSAGLAIRCAARLIRRFGRPRRHASAVRNCTLLDRG